MKIVRSIQIKLFLPKHIIYWYRKGNMIDSGSTYFGVNIPGFVLHSAIHSARPDALCVIHIHHPACIAVKSLLKRSFID